MNKRIGSVEIAAAFEQAKQVWQGKVTEADARDALVENFSMNSGSASDYIRNFGQMMKGEVFHRTLNNMAVKYYLNQINETFGAPYLHNAIRAIHAHIEYYENLPAGSAMPGLRAACREFEKLLPQRLNDLKSLKQLQNDFQRQITSSQRDTANERMSRIEAYDGKTETVTVSTHAYARNADIVAERLRIAEGNCENCQNPAPFNRLDGSPYLEVHHVLPLSEGGKDTICNTLALCPNCHREAHYGENRERFRAVADC